MTKYRTLLDESRLRVIRKYAVKARKMYGDFAELGVYKGGVAKMLSEVAPNKVMHLFDTFMGMPNIAVTGVDKHHAGDFADTDVESVRAYIGSDNADLYDGIFPGTFLKYVGGFFQGTQFSLVHLDADLYESTKAGIEIFWPRLIPGGIMILDDWLSSGCPGVLKAVADYFCGGQRNAVFKQEAPHQLVIIKEKP